MARKLSLPYVSRLDLRTPANQEAAAIDAAFDWPEFPARVEVFIATGQVAPRRFAFNLAHSAAYAVLSIGLAIVRDKYPVEYERARLLANAVGR